MPPPNRVTEPADEFAEFKKLFWAARRTHSKARKSASLDDPAHIAALRYAEARNWPWAPSLLTALYQTYRDNDHKALALVKELTVPASLAGERLFILGGAHYGLDQWTESIGCYLGALAIDGFAGSGYAWNNLGLAYEAKKDFDQAISAFRQALATPGYDTPGNAWINLGTAYALKKDFDQAISAYQQALATPDYDSPGKAWTNLGNAYAAKKDLEQAISAYQKALSTPGYDSPHLARLNLSISLRSVKRFPEARAEVERVLSEPDDEKEHERARRIASLIAAEEREIELKPDEVALVAPTPPDLPGGPEGAMKAALLKRETRYEEYLKRRPDDPQPDDLTILRGWSSSVTLLEGGQNCQWRGGGYFLKWRGHGLAIDPGFDFLDNFHDAGFHGTEISAVVVSHNHPDHNYDLGSLDDLCYELYRKAPNPAKTLFALDEDTAKAFPDNAPAHRGSVRKLTRADFEDQQWRGGARMKLPFTIEHFPVSHGTDVLHAVGLRIRLHAEKAGEPDVVIGYTGDGEFTDDLVKQLKGVDLLLAHVSQPDVAEFNDPSHLKKVHLGYNGLIRLVRETKPRLTLVGEFWAGLADLRLDLIAGIRLRSGVPAVLPACLGLRLRLQDFTVRCTRSGKQVPASAVKVAPPLREFGELGYLSPDSIL